MLLQTKGLLVLRKESIMCSHLCEVQSHIHPVSSAHFSRFRHLGTLCIKDILLFLPEASFLISEYIKCCFFNCPSRLTRLDLKSSLLLIYYMPLFFFNCNQNTICAEICCIRFLLWISTISIKHRLKSISPFGHEDKLNKQLHISSYAFFPLVVMVF